MASNKVGALIKSARTEAGLTQEQLAKKIDGLSASEISRAERGETELTQEELKAIAKATGVTQKSLLEAAKGTGTSRSTSSSKSASSSKDSSSETGMKLTATEKKLIELYRDADSDTKKSVMKLLKGEESDTATDTEEILTSILTSVVSQMTKK